MPVVVSIGRAPGSRLYPRGRNAYAAWGVSLYLLGIVLAARWPPSRRIRTGRVPRSARMSRFSEPQDPLFQALNSSISFDFRLAPYDLEQSLAHARMLAHGGSSAPRT